MPRSIRLSALILLAAAATALGGSRLAASSPEPAAPAAREAQTFAAVILGPSSIRGYTQCVWRANVTGGTPPYSYSWSVSNGSGSGSAWEWFGEFYSSGTLYLTVTDGNNQSVNVLKNITVTSAGPLCSNW